jgi:hypothetical protein
MVVRTTLFVLMSLATLGGCYVEAGGGVAEPVAVVPVQDGPPAPRYEPVITRPGFVWISGRWNWIGRWQWFPGHYEAERVGYVYEPGGWIIRGGRHVWVGGLWRARGASVVRVR